MRRGALFESIGRQGLRFGKVVVAWQAFIILLRCTLANSVRCQFYIRRPHAAERPTRIAVFANLSLAGATPIWRSGECLMSQLRLSGLAPLLLTLLLAAGPVAAARGAGLGYVTAEASLAF
jgi:hypothetical protein